MRPDRAVTQLILPLESESALGREDFIVAPANREAVAFVDAFPNWPAPAAAFVGPAGSGKSHLAAAWAMRAKARIVAASAIDAAALGDDAIVVEDIDRAPPDAARDNVLFALLERGTAMVVTAREPPGQWRAAVPDLSSRYRALLTFQFWETDEALLGALARKLFADRQLVVPDAAVEQMIRSLERSPEAIRDFVARADAKALAEKRPITAALVRELLPP